ncbi:MAG: hypothetical protein WAM79_08285 [Candidatus Sulfotelmatobacter sp.]
MKRHPSDSSACTLYGRLKDPFGHKWSIATHTKDLSMDEMKRGMDEAMAKMQKTA